MSNVEFASGSSCYILIYGNDAKVRNWAVALREYGCDLVPMPGSGARIGIYLIGSILRRRKRPAGVVFRYLNDYPSLLRTVARTLTEVAAVVLALLLRVRVLWICHNVDKESHAFHPRVSNFRRTFLARASTRVFVTDQLLEPEARRRLPVAEGKIGIVTFGAYARSVDHPAAAAFNRSVVQAIDEWRNRTGAEAPLLVGVCAGAAAQKVLHYSLIPTLISVAAECGFELRMIVVGELDEFLEANDPSVLNFLREDSRVFYHGSFVPLDELWLAKHVDFYWRAYTDLSIPFSYYVAATAGKPILSYGDSFQSRVVTRYRLGSVMKNDFSNCLEALQAVSAWDPKDSQEFLRSHTWATGAREIYRAVRPQPEGGDRCGH